MAASRRQRERGSSQQLLEGLLLKGHQSHTIVPVGRLARFRPHEAGAEIREAVPIGATKQGVVAFGGAAPSGGGAKEGINALSESKNKSENYFK
jgi:hypothetical protein